MRIASIPPGDPGSVAQPRIGLLFGRSDTGLFASVGRKREEEEDVIVVMVSKVCGLGQERVLGIDELSVVVAVLDKFFLSFFFSGPRGCRASVCIAAHQ